MKQKAFEVLTQDEQLEYAVQNGTYLMDRKDDDVTVRLFDVNGFYVEIFSLNETGVVVLIKSFNETEKLAPYLRQMDLSRMLI
jgi:hypothetical protein